MWRRTQPIKVSFDWLRRFSTGKKFVGFSSVQHCLLTCLVLSHLVSFASAQEITLTDATETSRVDFEHEDGSSGEQYLVELMGAGVGLLDYDTDGWIDIFLLNGSQLPGKPLAQAPREALFRNNHDGSFTNISRVSQAGDTFYSLGVVAGDYDNDGFEDIYLSNFQRKTLLHNNGDGTFSDVTIQAGVADENKFGAGAGFLDIDADGDLDLIAGNYVQFDFASHKSAAAKAFPYPPGPQHYPHIANTLYRNRGDGTFEDISQHSGLAAYKGPAMGLVCGDWDNDGDTDIFVGCDAEPNFLFINDGTGRFAESALAAGVAYDSTGNPVGSMGAEAGDIDNDGAEDLFVTDYSGQLPLMYRNLVEQMGRGQMNFADGSRACRAGSETLPHAKWGAGLFDVDNDRDRDLFICQGHLLKGAARIEQLTDYKVRNSLMLNDGRGKYSSITHRAGDGLAIVESTRGAGFDDLDNDGDVDVVLLNCAAAANLLRNESRHKNHWLEVELHGRKSNRSAVGSRVTITTGAVKQTAEIHAGRSYQSHYGTRLHFGLGEANAIERLEIQWHGQAVQVIEHIAPDQILSVVQPGPRGAR